MNNDVRMDSCVYEMDGATRQGLVKSILRSTIFKQHTFLVIRRLRAATPMSASEYATSRYNHRYYQYAVNSHGGVHLDIAHIRDIRYFSFLVIEPYSLKKVMDVDTIHVNVMGPETDSNKSRFYGVSGVLLTSFREKIDIGIPGS